ncbi:MAG: ATP phosphoribosyltransferase regulatory subunit [Rhizobiales bacterium]|nr:ATP phosphoribosyltransferase regulatory subunit [Hyphomicrobiales bacterium]
MAESYQPLRDLFSRAGYAFVEPPILHDARIFVELAGEDLRRRLFLATDAEGRELALRPDYTIPVCLQHLAGGPARRRANYAYLGPVFRQRPGAPGEFLQAGVESLGRTDREAADADVLKLALESAATLGVRKPSVRIGDSTLFAALLDALDVSLPWQRRLARSFGDTRRLAALIARGRSDNGARRRVVPVALGRERREAEARAGELLAAHGLATVGGRTAEEIAGRVVEKTELAAGIGARAAKVLSAYLALAGSKAAAPGLLRAFARRERVAIGPTIDRFAERVEALAKAGVDPARLAFAADFGRRLDYYTGFVFEIHDAARPKLAQIVGGGRYDRLLALIPGQTAAKGNIPAIGFSIWLDRIGGAP